MQTAGASGSVEPNLEQLAVQAAEAAGIGARLLVTPEMFLSGYNIGAPAIRELAEPADGRAAARVAGIAGEHRIAILYGYPERDGDAVFNAAKLVGADGATLADYRKCHLYGDVDRDAFAAGNGFVRTDLEGVPVGILICYDVEFPEAVRANALAGAVLVLVPTALMEPFDFVARTLVRARAFENQIFVVYANRCGVEGEFRYLGKSLVAGPDGAVVAEANASEALLIADVNVDEFTLSRRAFSYLEDRRPELYGDIPR
ncbi:MAG: carbon-nitrogen hydrolase family protein [Gammaproteobacteria bacterium]|nr:carbon-nitrogen hydrolase family protein [Gammaproteobacteria bacterium]